MASNTSVITTNLRLINAKNFANNVVNGNDFMYLFIGRPQEWADEDNPPIANDTVQTTDFDHWRDMIGVRKAVTSDINYVIPRVDWANGVIYDMYTDTSTQLSQASGVWSYLNNINLGRAYGSGAGKGNTALFMGGWINSQANYTAYVEEYNGDVWNVVSGLNSAKNSQASCGTVDAALCIGGSNASILTSTEIWDGASWSADAVLNTAKSSHTAVGTTTAAMQTGGVTTGHTSVAVTEDYNGATWSVGGSLNTARKQHAGFGIADNAVAMGGYSTSSSIRLNSTETYNGTAWTVGNNSNLSRSLTGSAGLSTAGLVTGGTTGALVQTTEEYNNNVWLIKDPMNSKRYAHSATGEQNLSIHIAGFYLQDQNIVETYQKIAIGEDGLVGSPFYALTSDYRVYKCLYNNFESPSTVEPTTTSSTTVQTTGDGYIWKYMYELSTTEVENYLTADWIPVKYLSSDDGSDQWDVQTNAANGAIHVIQMNSNGSAFSDHSGTIGSVTNSTVMTLDGCSSPSFNSQDDFYVGSVLYIDSGTGEGQVKEIVDFTGSSGLVTVNNAFSPVPVGSSSTYKVLPKVAFTGDGSDALGVANVSSNTIVGVTMLNEGSGYTKNQEFDGTSIVTFSANVGSGATGTAVISPLHGHGNNPLDELFGFNVLFHFETSGNVSSEFTTSNDFRKYGLVLNPLATANNGTFEEASGDQCIRLTVSANTGIFQADELVTGGTSGAEAIVVDYADRANSVLRVVRANGTFTATETITGGTSGDTATVDSVANGDCIINTGDIITTSHREKITRASDQDEEYNIVLKF